MSAFQLDTLPAELSCQLFQFSEAVFTDQQHLVILTEGADLDGMSILLYQLDPKDLTDSLQHYANRCPCLCDTYYVIYHLPLYSCTFSSPCSPQA